MYPRRLLRYVLVNVRISTFATDLLLRIMLLLGEVWPTITVLLLAIWFSIIRWPWIRRVSFCIYIVYALSHLLKIIHWLLLFLSCINLTSISSSSMIWILGGMCKRLLLGPCTTLKLCRRDRRLLGVIAIIGRGIVVYVAKPSERVAECNCVGVSLPDAILSNSAADAIIFPFAFAFVRWVDDCDS